MKKVLSVLLIASSVAFSVKAMNEMGALSGSNSSIGQKSLILIANEQRQADERKRIEKGRRERRREFLSSSKSSTCSPESNRDGSHMHRSSESAGMYGAMILPDDIEIIGSEQYKKNKREIPIKIQLQQQLLPSSKSSSFGSLDAATDDLSCYESRAVITKLPKDIPIMDFERYERISARLRMESEVESEVESIYSELEDICNTLSSLQKKFESLSLQEKL
jgi:hypothetical protein